MIYTRKIYTPYNETPMKGFIMETVELPTLTVFEKPSLQDQLIVGAVSATVAVLAPVAITLAAKGLTRVFSGRKNRKLKETTPLLNQD